MNSHVDWEVVLSGDLNWSLDRDNQFTRIMSAAVEKMNLVPLCREHQVDYTHIHTENKSVSTIDHYILSPGVPALVEWCDPVHRGDNLSRHSPIFLRQQIKNHGTIKPSKRVRRSRPAWKKATEEETASYTAQSEEQLSNSPVHQSAMTLTVRWRNIVEPRTSWCWTSSVAWWRPAT